MRGVPKSGTVVTMKDGRTRRYRSIEERRQIVEETLKAGASVALIARAHDVNANQVFKWRRQYQRGQLEDGSSTLLPVQISEAVPAKPVTPKDISRRLGSIDIDLGHARLRIEGRADPDCIRAALQGLIR